MWNVAAGGVGKFHANLKCCVVSGCQRASVVAMVRNWREVAANVASAVGGRRGRILWIRRS